MCPVCDKVQVNMHVTLSRAVSATALSQVFKEMTSTFCMGVRPHRMFGCKFLLLASAFAHGLVL